MKRLVRFSSVDRASKAVFGGLLMIGLLLIVLHVVAAFIVNNFVPILIVAIAGFIGFVAWKVIRNYYYRRSF